jgi:hypothetical protein
MGWNLHRVDASPPSAHALAHGRILPIYSISCCLAYVCTIFRGASSVSRRSRTRQLDQCMLSRRHDRLCMSVRTRARIGHIFARKSALDRCHRRHASNLAKENACFATTVRIFIQSAWTKSSKSRVLCLACRRLRATVLWRCLSDWSENFCIFASAIMT